MKQESIKRAAALMLAVAALSSSAAALFGKETDTVPEEGAPVAQDLQIRTYRGIPYQAQFLASDGEGDDITYAVEEAPGKGTVEVDGANFTYTPEEGATGGDRFTYTATDSAGHVSVPATVTVTIEKVKSGVTYADTEGSAAAVAAQDLAEAGIFTGAQIGGQYYFEPDRTVSREEFLAMVLETAGREVTEVTMTGFCDDEGIPAWAKAYAAAGVADGVVQGSTTEEGAAFRGAGCRRCGPDGMVCRPAGGAHLGGTGGGKHGGVECALSRKLRQRCHGGGYDPGGCCPDALGCQNIAGRGTIRRMV